MVCALAALAAVVACGALAGGAAKDPKAVVLQGSDLPAGAVRQPYGAVVNGGTARIFSVTFNFKNGANEEEVTSFAAVAKDKEAAESTYRLQVAGNTGLPGDTIVKLPSYGDEQTADFFSKGSAARARGEVIVRRNNVVWSVTVENCGPYSPYGCSGGKTPPNITTAQALAELKKLAPRQKARVGSG
jgi:hypothetical protein